MSLADKDGSKYRLVLYIKDAFRKDYKKLFGREFNMWVEYSFTHLDKRPGDKGLDRLIKRVESTHKGKFQTALIYNNQTDELIAKWVFDIQEL